MSVDAKNEEEKSIGFFDTLKKALQDVRELFPDTIKDATGSIFGAIYSMITGIIDFFKKMFTRFTTYFASTDTQENKETVSSSIDPENLDLEPKLELENKMPLIDQKLDQTEASKNIQDLIKTEEEQIKFIETGIKAEEEPEEELIEFMEPEEESFKLIKEESIKCITHGYDDIRKDDQDFDVPALKPTIAPVEVPTIAPRHRPAPAA